MKINAYEIEKIRTALESISGWKVDRFDIWESASGIPMVTVRLRQIEESNIPGVGIQTELVKNEEKERV